jgi:hypothetical protein
VNEYIVVYGDGIKESIMADDLLGIYDQQRDEEIVAIIKIS